MSNRYGDRDYDRGQRDYGRRSNSDYDRSYRERSQGRSSYGRDEDEQDRYERESRSAGEYRSSRYGPGRSSRGGEYRGGSPWRSYGERSRDYDYDYDYERRGEERGWLDRLASKLAAWFGDEEAERRYRMDDQRERRRGMGPKSYRRSDERIREDVNDHLSEGYLDASEIEVVVVDGVVTLSGTVNSRSDKRRAEDTADDVRGVKNVENRLRVGQRDVDRYPSLHGTTARGKAAGS